MDTGGDYYLGRIFDSHSGQTTDEALLYDPDDLTTHGVVVGMTGSGKTGLCLDLLEEAALNEVPALMIDPKGDITNALLHFPDLLPSDFQPWINADQARRDDKSLEQAAADTAALWKNGLSQWGIGRERLAKLKESVQFAIYTPGSDAGLSISILASLQAPDIPWDDNEEVLRERITSTVTALLGLAGLRDVDPVRSREHILLANIFEQAWSQGRDLDLGELIMQTQTPPFDKLGVFDVNTFFPEKDRFELAMTLNNILASPSFQAWIEGQPLDIQSLLYAPDGRPRHSVFYIAHLNDEERMFFVTLLFSAVETWMRTQKGSTSLRSLVYFDEIFGYLPPIGNPPSKESMLRMLKQARAFGVGLVLATQNPVDVDYKALSNAGTWFIGKLQTDQDKQRLLDGLSGAAGAMDRREYDDLLSSLGKRVFLLHNVHEKKPALFQTRWAMNYLAGPMTRTQIPALNDLAGASEVATAVTAAATGAGPAAARPRAAAAEAAGVAPELGSRTRPAVPGRVMEYFLPNNLTVSQAARIEDRRLPAGAKSLGLLYRPTLLAQAEIRFNNPKYDLRDVVNRAALVIEPDERGMVLWEQQLVEPIETRDLDRGPAPEATFAGLEEPLTDASLIRSMEGDFQEWIYRNVTVTVRVNEELDVFAGPDVSDREFQRRCEEAAAERRDAELKKADEAFDRKVDRVMDKLEREQRELREDETEYAQRKREEGLSHAETVLSLFTSRRKSLSSSLTKRRMTERAKADVEESIEVIKELEAEIEELKAEEKEARAEIEERWAEVVEQVDEVLINPYKKDIAVTLFGVAWLPYHLVEAGGRTMELAGFEVKAVA
ncbi:MAG: hypothetical protein PVG33_08980 [Chloroflexota bacterium]|jgi:hypothetical protein